MVEKYQSLLSFLPFLYILQSLSFCTKAGGLAMMSGIIYTNLINMNPLPIPSVSFHSPLPSCTMGPQHSSFPKMHLCKVPLAAVL